MRFVIFACLLLFIITPTKSDEFKCSLDQGTDDKNCWSMSYLCSVELYFMRTPEAMKPRQFLFTKPEDQEEHICRSLAILFRVTVKGRCKIDKVLNGRDKSKIDAIKAAIVNKSFPDLGK